MSENMRPELAWFLLGKMVGSASLHLDVDHDDNGGLHDMLHEVQMQVERAIYAPEKPSDDLLRAVGELSVKGRCTGSSWRGHSRATSEPYGPGSFNQCLLEAGHPGEHMDVWGNKWEEAIE